MDSKELSRVVADLLADEDREVRGNVTVHRGVERLLAAGGAAIAPLAAAIDAVARAVGRERTRLRESGAPNRLQHPGLREVLAVYLCLLVDSGAEVASILDDLRRASPPVHAAALHALRFALAGPPPPALRAYLESMSGDADERRAAADALAARPRPRDLLDALAFPPPARRLLDAVCAAGPDGAARLGCPCGGPLRIVVTVFDDERSAFSVACTACDSGVHAQIATATARPWVKGARSSTTITEPGPGA